MVRRVFDPHQPHHAPDPADQPATVAEVPEREWPRVRHVETVHPDGESVFEQVAHELLPTAAECAELENAVTPATVRQAVEELISGEPSLEALLPGEEARRDLMHIFLALPLSPPLAFKLTMARDWRPEVLDHSLRVAYCAAAIAKHCRMAHHEIVNAAAAGLFHDLGLLHVDPDLLQNAQPLQEHQRHHLYSHPLTAFLILEHSPIWHPVVSTAVLEHHERLDGSGYPKGLAEDKLGQLGQLLAVAEVAATLLADYSDGSPRNRLGIVLRMNEGKLNHEFCSALLAMLPPDAAAETPQHRLGEVLEVLVELAIAFLRWQAVAQQEPPGPLTAFIGKRMERLGRSLAGAGVDLEYWSAMDADVEFDTAALSEMEVAAREGVWQLHAIVNEVDRRREHFVVGDEPIAAAVVEWIDSIKNIRAG